MLTKCSNPFCSASFHSLGNGRLFRLEPDPALGARTCKRVEYYWLCQRCASIMTLRLGDHEDVIAVVLPAALEGATHLEALTLAERKRGLLLQDVASQLPKHSSHRVGSRLTYRHHVA